MPRAPRISRVQALALPRPQAAETNEWILAAVALALLLAALVA